MAHEFESTTERSQVVGVVGAAGDLGSQVVDMATERGFKVISLDRRCLGSTTLKILMDDSDIVHFCIPAASFEEPHELRTDQLGILHDSVMAKSMQANAEFFSGNADIVHMLMNPKTRSVVVESSNSHQDQVKAHVIALGLAPIEKSAQNHDHIMAHSQALFALGVATQLEKLNQWADEGLLTPSGEAAHEAFLDRSAKWTPQTLRSILSNPELPAVLEEMQQMIANGGEL